jgi:hypothetical protein
MSRNLPECTAAAVTGILAASGFLISTPGEFGEGWRSAGVYTADLPLAYPRVAIYFWPDSPSADLEERVTRTLSAVGYQAERVAEHPRDYLVAWTEGDF